MSAMPNQAPSFRSGDIEEVYDVLRPGANPARLVQPNLRAECLERAVILITVCRVTVRPGACLKRAYPQQTAQEGC
jgi:hypothetical protein